MKPFTILSCTNLKMTKHGKLMFEKRKYLRGKWQETLNYQDKDIIPRAAGCWHFILYPEANYVLYHILRAREAAGCALPSLNTDFRTGQCRYFLQDGMNLSIELKLGMLHTLVESSATQKSLCSYALSGYTLFLIWTCKICTTSKI